MVVEVRNETHAPHLVALVKVPDDGWYLFNDFVVQAVSEDEALSFVGAWKVCIALFCVTLPLLTIHDSRLPAYYTLNGRITLRLWISACCP